MSSAETLNVMTDDGKICEGRKNANAKTGNPRRRSADAVPRRMKGRCVIVILIRAGTCRGGDL